MRVVQLDYSDREFPASLVEIDSPPLPGPDWVRLRVTRGGICGSDLHFFNPSTGSTAVLAPYVALPIQLGHEIVGVVAEVGSEADAIEGERVAVDPVVGCLARGIELCRHCQRGAASACENIGSRRLTPGMGLGFTNGLGAGWADEVLAHSSMLHRIPDSLDDDVAVMHEPLSIAIHGLDRSPPSDGEPILVVGAGIIGLASVAAARSVAPGSEITVVAKHPHQRSAALEVGADHVVAPGDLEELARISGTRVMGGQMLAGGFPYVVEAVGTPSSVTQAFRTVAGRGTVLLLGAVGKVEVDLTPVWFKEARVAGAFCHAMDGSSHSIDRALEILASGGLPPGLVTHRFALDRYREAIETALSKESGAIKVVLMP